MEPSYPDSEPAQPHQSSQAVRLAHYDLAEAFAPSLKAQLVSGHRPEESFDSDIHAFDYPRYLPRTLDDLTSDLSDLESESEDKHPLMIGSGDDAVSELDSEYTGGSDMESQRAMPEPILDSGEEDVSASDFACSSGDVSVDYEPESMIYSSDGEASRREGLQFEGGAAQAWRYVGTKHSAHFLFDFFTRSLQLPAPSSSRRRPLAPLLPLKKRGNSQPPQKDRKSVV